MEESDRGRLHSCQKWNCDLMRKTVSPFIYPSHLRKLMQMTHRTQKCLFGEEREGRGEGAETGETRKMDWQRGQETERFKAPKAEQWNCICVNTRSHSVCVNEDVNGIVMESMSSAAFYLQCGGNLCHCWCCVGFFMSLLGRHSAQKEQPLWCCH